jgi:hypothetical protein
MPTSLKSDLTAEEINRYWDAYFAVVDGLIVAQSKLQKLEDKATDLGDRSGYRADRLRVEADIELMRSKRMAFNDDNSSISPPNQATVDKLVDLSKEVANLAATRQRAAALVGLAAKAVSEFNKLQKSP